MKNSGWKRLCSLLLCLTMLASLLAGCGGRTAVTEPETPEPAQQTEAEPVQVAAGEREDEPVPVAPQPIAREAIEAALDKAGASAETLAVTVRSQDLDKVLAELRGADGVEDARPVADNGDTAVIGVTPSPDADPDLEDLEGVEDVAPADEAEIPLTDLPATWHGERRDEDGNLNVPFDVAYPAAFAQETTTYCQDHLLLRVDKGFDGELNHDLALCGFVSVERFLEKEDFDWYRADLAQGVSIATAASFTVTAEGTGLTYQWQYRSSKDGKWYNAKVDGANTSTMRIGVTDARNGMKFRCKVTDAYGNQEISDAATLRVG